MGLTPFPIVVTSKGNRSNKKAKVIKISIFSQSIFKDECPYFAENFFEAFENRKNFMKNIFAEKPKNEFVENISQNICFGTFGNRKDFSKTKDLKNEDKNNSAKKEFLQKKDIHLYTMLYLQKMSVPFLLKCPFFHSSLRGSCSVLTG